MPGPQGPSCITCSDETQGGSSGEEGLCSLGFHSTLSRMKAMNLFPCPSKPNSAPTCFLLIHQAHRL